VPIFHSQLGLEIKDQAGNKKKLSSREALLFRGPVFQITLGLAENIAQQLVQQGQDVPEPIAGWALLDTGASSTCIDDTAAQKLKLPVIDKGKMSSASHGAIDVNIYPALISFTGTPIKINVLRAIGANLASQELIALLGRDLLQNFTIFYNGAFGQITISF
jgi:predicted aspartyl protease